MSVENIGANRAVQQMPEELIAGEETIQKVVDEILPILGDGASVSVTSGRRVDGSERARALRDVPELEKADLEALVTTLEADLEALVALLTAEQDEKSIAAAKARIESLRGQMKARHDKTMKKVDESIEAMKDQEKAAKANRILGWLGVAVAIISAIAMVATAGLCAPAVLALVGAGIGLACQVLTETGHIEKLTKAISDSIKKSHPDWSREKCDFFAQLSTFAIILAATLPCFIGGHFAKGGVEASKFLVQKVGAELAQKIVNGVRIGTTAANIGMSGLSAVAGGVGSAMNYKAAEKQADVTEMEQFLAQLKALLEMEQNEIEELLSKLQDAFSTVVELLDSKQKTLNQISMEIGA